jgi:hypothetical protein
VIVEGNIASGKTTLAVDLAQKLGCKVFLEPTAVNPYLELFYQDPKKVCTLAGSSSSCAPPMSARQSVGPSHTDFCLAMHELRHT